MIANGPPDYYSHTFLLNFLFIETNLWAPGPSGVL